MSWHSRKEWQKKSKRTNWTFTSAGAGQKILDKPQTLTNSTHPSAIKGQIVVDEIVMCLGTATHTSNELIHLTLYDGDPSGAGTAIGPELRVSTGSGGPGMVALYDLAIEVGRDKELWGRGTSTTAGQSVTVYIEYHLEPAGTDN
ncbi:MAG: hypothetical protein ACE5FA_09570 [Dehalococcoidia bacterium]